jgi:Ca2+-binding EF-hand superfamily protein
VRNSNGLFHMMRMLSRRGVFIEALLKEKDPDNRGFMSKSLFFSVTRSLGLPFSRKEINEILDRYSSPTNEIDYEALLRDAGIQLLHQSSEDVSQSVDSYGNVLIEVKRMILELVNNYGKSFDDVYGMFSCWDHDGTGSVTSTQFLRVLSRLHIELSDSLNSLQQTTLNSGTQEKAASRPSTANQATSGSGPSTGMSDKLRESLLRVSREHYASIKKVGMHPQTVCE